MPKSPSSHVILAICVASCAGNHSDIQRGGKGGRPEAAIKIRIRTPQSSGYSECTHAGRTDRSLVEPLNRFVENKILMPKEKIVESVVFLPTFGRGYPRITDARRKQIASNEVITIIDPRAPDGELIVARSGETLRYCISTHRTETGVSLVLDLAAVSQGSPLR